MAQSSGEAVTERKRIERINIEEILLQEAASHGTASWVFERVVFLAGLISLFIASIQTENPWIMIGVIFILFAKALTQRRLSDPNDPLEPWWPLL